MNFPWRVSWLETQKYQFFYKIYPKGKETFISEPGKRWRNSCRRWDNGSRPLFGDGTLTNVTITEAPTLKPTMQKYTVTNKEHIRIRQTLSGHSDYNHMETCANFSFFHKRSSRWSGPRPNSWQSCGTPGHCLWHLPVWETAKTFWVIPVCASQESGTLRGACEWFKQNIPLYICMLLFWQTNIYKIIFFTQQSRGCENRLLIWKGGAYTEKRSRATVLTTVIIPLSHLSRLLSVCF